MERGSNPRSPSPDPPSVEPGSEKEKFREAYLSRVQELLAAPDLTYCALYRNVASDRWLGRSLDERVVEAELDSGHSLQQVQCLLAQSPYVQLQLSEGGWERDGAVVYIGELTAQLQPDRKPEEELSE